LVFFFLLLSAKARSEHREAETKLFGYQSRRDEMVRTARAEWKQKHGAWVELWPKEQILIDLKAILKNAVPNTSYTRGNWVCYSSPDSSRQAIADAQERFAIIIRHMIFFLLLAFCVRHSSPSRAKAVTHRKSSPFFACMPSHKKDPEFHNCEGVFVISESLLKKFGESRCMWLRPTIDRGVWAEFRNYEATQADVDEYVAQFKTSDAKMESAPKDKTWILDDMNTEGDAYA
jgi:hypothetical protein